MSDTLRFGVGDPVRCKVSATQWKKGTVVALHYREDQWPEGMVAPYQVQLNNGPLIYAPQDDDRLIQADDGMELEVAVATGGRAEIHVCQAGPCRRAGGEAVLLEIEELAKSVGGRSAQPGERRAGRTGVTVQPSGCLGNCSQAPNALLVTDADEHMFARRCALSDSAEVVERASGVAPSMDDADMVARLQRARRLRVRMEAREESKWNLALAGLKEDVAQAKCEDDRAELVQEQAELLASAGFGDKALEVLSTLASVDDLSLDDIPTLRLLLDQAKILAQLGRIAQLQGLSRAVDELLPRDSRETSIKSQVLEILAETMADARANEAAGASGQPAGQPQRVQDYARWRLHAITPVSKHSAVYHFRSDDPARGTPIRKGRGGRTVWSKTWHTTLLAEVGEARNTEGPLPWIERDYTPISTGVPSPARPTARRAVPRPAKPCRAPPRRATRRAAHDWESGKCDILIKIYLEPPGLATEWLHRVSAAGATAGPGAEVWLSRPMKTLHVPSLSADDKFINRKHASVLLIVAGTGVVAIPQVLHHAQATTCFGAKPPVTQPVSAIYSCRTDDALLIPELAGLCRDGSLSRCTVLVTASQSATAPFPDVADTDVAAAFAGLDNAACVNARLSLEMLQAELSHMARPLRVVVSGPEGFNSACKSMLKQIDSELGAEAVTILSA